MPETTFHHASRSHVEAQTPYERAVLGFRNYWYPALLSCEVKEKPVSLKLLGDDVIFLRRGGKAYALADECAHRGTRLSRGRYEFPGTNTITCCYHGWTYDVTNGNCVAALTDGPDSPVAGKVRIRTYPVEERKGIVWIWTGEMAPVALEEDVPAVLLRRDTVVKVYRRTAYGNWRWHAENPGGNHAYMLHRTSLHMFFQALPAYSVNRRSYLKLEGEDGEWLVNESGRPTMEGEYPGLGKWPRRRFWQRPGRKEGAIFGVNTRVGQRLPGITRVTHFPLVGAMYYEWYVPVDADHYNYFQVSCGPIESIWDWLSFHVRYYLYGLPVAIILFNRQDMRMVADSTDYAKRHGGNWPSPIFRPDGFEIAWRKMCNEQARGQETLSRPSESRSVGAS